jgi:hypothetical protein
VPGEGITSSEEKINGGGGNRNLTSDHQDGPGCTMKLTPKIDKNRISMSPSGS